MFDRGDKIKPSRARFTTVFALSHQAHDYAIRFACGTILWWQLPNCPSLPSVQTHCQDLIASAKQAAQKLRSEFEAQLGRMAKKVCIP